MTSVPSKRRDTSTGWVLEQMVLPALQRGEYECRVQVDVGARLGHGRHFVDAVVEKDGVRILVSVKWQQTSGTAEQKVPFEVMCLAEALRTPDFARAYLVLGGEGWKLRPFFTSGELGRRIVSADRVHVALA